MESLALFALVATLTPGGATTLATASGARFGFRRSVPLMTGIAVGLGTLAAAAAAGLAGVLLAFPLLQTGMKLVGSAYLLWLAWKTASAGRPTAGAGPQSPASFLGGALLLWLNPKGWAMAFGAAASFAMLTTDPWRLGLLLGTTFALSAGVSLTLWCLAGLMLGRMLRSEREWRLVNAGLGLLLALSILPMWR